MSPEGVFPAMGLRFNRYVFLHRFYVASAKPPYEARAKRAEVGARPTPGACHLPGALLPFLGRRRRPGFIHELAPTGSFGAWLADTDLGGGRRLRKARPGAHWGPAARPCSLSQARESMKACKGRLLPGMVLPQDIDSFSFASGPVICESLRAECMGLCMGLAGLTGPNHMLTCCCGALLTAGHFRHSSFECWSQ